MRHRAFQLQPDISEVVPTTQLLARKYGAPESQIAQMQANVCSIAGGEGPCYKLDETLSGNAADAHRLILMADEFGKQDELLEAIVEESGISGAQPLEVFARTFDAAWKAQEDAQI